MIIKIELDIKLEQPLNEILKSLEKMNPNKIVNAESVLGTVCRNYIANEYAKLLMIE